MILTTLLLQASLLAHPLFLEPEKPELRSMQHILLWHDGMEGLPRPQGRNEEETIELMESLITRLEQGTSFTELAQAFSSARTGRYGGSLGTYPKGMLKTDFDDFLFRAELGDLSPVFVNEQGVHLLKRIETHAAILQIQLEGTDQRATDQATELIKQLEAGADFGELAEQHSVDPISKANAGKFCVFERGERDSMIKGAAFEASVGELVGPIVTPLGTHIIKRVEPAGFARELWEDNFIQVSGILISHLKALGVPKDLNRTQSEAKSMADEVIRRVNAGEDFNEIAARFNDDPGGKERRGYLGWIHRHNPDLPIFFGRLFVGKPGTLTEPALTPAGVVVLRRH